MKLQPRLSSHSEGRRLGVWYRFHDWIELRRQLRLDRLALPVEPHPALPIQLFANGPGDPVLPPLEDDPVAFMKGLFGMQSAAGEPGPPIDPPRQIFGALETVEERVMKGGSFRQEAKESLKLRARNGPRCGLERA